MKFNWPQIKPGDSEAKARALLIRMRDELTAALSKRVSIEDNLLAEIVEIPFVHGQQIEPRKSPLRGASTPRGFDPIFAVDDNDEEITVPDCAFHPAASEGRWAITANAKPPSGAIVVARTSSDQSVSNATTTPVQFDSLDYIEGDNVSYSASANTKITFAVAGRVSVGIQARFDSFANGYRLGCVRKNGSGYEYACHVMPGGSYAGLNGSDEITVEANDYIQFQVYQSSGGALNILATSGAIRASMRARYVAPPDGYAGTVFGILWGG